jgi:hypothetical protein
MRRALKRAGVNLVLRSNAKMDRKGTSVAIPECPHLSPKEKLRACNAAADGRGSRCPSEPKLRIAVALRVVLEVFSNGILAAA